MTIAIGRAGRDTGLTLNSPAYWNIDGDEVDCGGSLTASSYVRLVILRAQFTGLAANIDEPVVPVNWTGDATVDGYYEVAGAEVPMPPRGLAALKLDWRAKLRRVAAHPDIQSRMIGNRVKTNDGGVVKASTVPWWACPDDATMDYIPDASSATRAGADGTARVWYRTDGTVLYNRTNRWQCLASDYYDAACRVELYDGTGYYTLVGRRLPNTNVQVGWRITNGLVRASYGGGDGLLKVEHYVSGSWSVSKIYKLTTGTGPTTIGAIRTVTVKQNSPEQVTVRLGFDQDNTTTPAAVTVDLTLRRGALWVDGRMSRSAEIVAALATGMGIYRSTAEAATAHTNGVHATAADAAGGKYLLNTTNAKTNDLTQGGFRTGTTATDFDFQVGYEPPSAVSIDDFTRQTYAWLACLDESVGFARR